MPTVYVVETGEIVILRTVRVKYIKEVLLAREFREGTLIAKMLPGESVAAYAKSRNWKKLGAL